MTTIPDLKELLARATKGPWVFVEENAGLMPDHGYGILHGKPGAGGWEENLFISVGCSNGAARQLGESAPKANAELVALAPTLAQRVIDQDAEIERLRAALQRAWEPRPSKQCPNCGDLKGIGDCNHSSSGPLGTLYGVCKKCADRHTEYSTVVATIAKGE